VALGVKLDVASVSESTIAWQQQSETKKEKNAPDDVERFFYFRAALIL
jgi:hypothetical protein